MDFSSVIINSSYQNIYVPIADSVLYNIRYKTDKIRTYNKRRSLSEKLGTIRLRYAAAANQTQDRAQGQTQEQDEKVSKEPVAIRNKKSNRSATYKQQH